MNVMVLLALFVGVAIGFTVAFFLGTLAYRTAQMNLHEAEMYERLAVKEKEAHADLGRRPASEEAEEHPVEPELLDGPDGDER